MSKAHLTAISRNALSTPAAFLFASGLLVGHTLDYGCGKGDDLARLRSMVHGMQGYDPHFRPLPPIGDFDTIMCNFVLNVIEDEDDRALAVLRILSYLKPNGVAYISVRNDKRNLRGHTSKGTWQGYVELPYEVVSKTSAYVMYKVSKASL